MKRFKKCIFSKTPTSINEVMIFHAPADFLIQSIINKKYTVFFTFFFIAVFFQFVFHQYHIVLRTILETDTNYRVGIQTYWLFENRIVSYCSQIVRSKCTTKSWDFTDVG